MYRIIKHVQHRLLWIVFLMLSIFVIPGSFSPKVYAADTSTLSYASQIIPYFDTRIYLHQLTDAELMDFCTLYQSMQRFDSECDLPHTISEESFNMLTFYLNYETPELMQYNSDNNPVYYYYADQSQTTVNRCDFRYSITKEEYDSMFAAVQTEINALAAQASGLNILEQECLIYRHIIEKNTYNTTSANSTNAYGVLVEGQARCEGIARTVKWFMDAIGVPCVCRRGVMNDPGYMENHIWNAVKIGEQFYCLDATVDDDEGYPIPYAHINVPESWILPHYDYLDSRCSRIQLPMKSDMSECYHAIHGTLIRPEDSALDMLHSLLWQAYNSGGETIRFQIEDSSVFNDFCQNISTYINDWGYGNNIPQWNYHWYYFNRGQTFIVEITF